MIHIICTVTTAAVMIAGGDQVYIYYILLLPTAGCGAGCLI